jgi:hypothetical protein
MIHIILKLKYFLSIIFFPYGTPYLNTYAIFLLPNIRCRKGLEILTLIQKREEYTPVGFYEDLKVKINPKNTQIQNYNKEIQKVHIQYKYNY